MKTTKAAAKQITAEFRAAKKHLESLVGVAAFGLDRWLSDYVASVSAPVLAVEVKTFYAVNGGDVSADALKTLAYARVARAWQAYAAL